MGNAYLIFGTYAFCQAYSHKSHLFGPLHPALHHMLKKYRLCNRILILMEGIVKQTVDSTFVVFCEVFVVRMYPLENFESVQYFAFETPPNLVLDVASCEHECSQGKMRINFV